MTATMDVGPFVVSPQPALWLPAGVEHEVLRRSGCRCARSTLMLSQQMESDSQKWMFTIGRRLSSMRKTKLIPSERLDPANDNRGASRRAFLGRPIAKTQLIHVRRTTRTSASEWVANPKPWFAAARDGQEPV
jgi:hypothetical protein